MEVLYKHRGSHFNSRYLWLLYQNQRINRFDTSEETWETIHFTGRRFHDETLKNITFRALDVMDWRRTPGALASDGDILWIDDYVVWVARANGLSKIDKLLLDE
ncbi:MAG: hypothetical protein ACE5OR_14495 [bacterium]